VAADGHVDDLAPWPEFLNDGTLRVLGEGGDRVDPGLHLREDPLQVLSLLQLDRHGACPFGRGARELLQPGKPLELLLDAAADALLDLLRGRAGVDDPHLDDLRRELGEDLDLQPTDRQGAARTEKHHEDVGRHPVLHEPGDHPLGLVLRQRPGRVLASVPVLGH